MALIVACSSHSQTMRAYRETQEQMFDKGASLHAFVEAKLSHVFMLP